MRGVLSIMNGQEDRGLAEVERAVQADPKLRADADAVRARMAPR
jgi:hypothetical protein